MGDLVVAKTRDFYEVIRREIAADKNLELDVERESINSDIAEQILAAREAADITQGELAKRAKTHQSVIARLEDADYPGSHALSSLIRIADALDLRVKVEFYSKRQFQELSVSSPIAWNVPGVEWKPTMKITGDRAFSQSLYFALADVK